MTFVNGHCAIQADREKQTKHMKNRHILWADDDVDDLMLMRHILQDLDQPCDIAEVHNGQEAIDYLHSMKARNSLPCLIILDMNMPVLDGKEALMKLKKDEELRKIPVVFFTTSNSPIDRLYCQYHNVEMVTKPTQYDSLKEAMLRILKLCL